MPFTNPAPSAPRDLQVVQTFKKKIELKWMRPAELNGELTEYILTDNTGTETTITSNLQEEIVYTNLTDLESGKEYIITVS